MEFDEGRTATAGDRAVWSQRDLGWEGLVLEARRLGRDPVFEGVSDARLEEDLCGVAAQMAALTGRWLELLCELVVRGIWADQGARTPAQWLSWKVGMAPSTAREQVRVALRLRELPRVRQALAAGSLSYSKVRAITRVAVPEIEDLLLQWADVSTAAQLERIAADFRTVQRLAVGSEPDDVDERRYSWRIRSHGDGTSSLTIRAPSEECAELTEMIERRVDAARGDIHPDDGEPDGVHHPGVDRLGQRVAQRSDQDVGQAEHPGLGQVEDGPAPAGRAAALVEELIGLVAGADPLVPADTSGLDRHTLVLHASADAIAEEGPDRVPVEDRHGRVRGMDRRTLRRLACEAGIVLAAVDRTGSPMDLGRRDRRLSAALRRAVHLRDRSCRFPGCDSTRHLHAHHVHHWADGGPTDLSNLVLLCSHHHRFVHQNGWTIEVRPDAQHRFAPPDGAAVERRPRLQRTAESPFPPPAEELERLQPSYVDLDHPMDRNTIIAVLHQEITRLAPDLTHAA